MQQVDFLIVGAGLFGAAFAWRAQQRGHSCLVIDKRPHTGGNLYCEQVEGIQVHKYGAHIFHTNNKRVWQMVNSIVEFNRYTNSPVASYKGKLYNLPFNMNTFYQMWGVTTPQQAQQIIEEQREETVQMMRSQGVLQPRNLEEQALMLIGRDIYERLIKGYTEKQWGRKCTLLPPFIIRRLPVRMVFDNNYFNDAYQGIPIGGYNKLIDGLLERADVRTGIDFLQLPRTWDEKRKAFRVAMPEGEILCSKIVFSGMIDEFFHFSLGHLEYRTVRFEQQTLDMPNFQGNAVVNYTDVEVPYTRIIEHKHFECFGQRVYELPKTVVSREYSMEWKPGMEPYYPVNDERNSALYQQYLALAKQQPNIIFGGRLAEYKYYDMAPILEKVMEMEI